MQNKTMPRNRQNSEARESVNAILVFLALSQKRLGYVDIRKRKASGLQVFTVSEKKEKKRINTKSNLLQKQRLSFSNLFL